MPELFRSKALVINAIRWHESSKILTLYAREWGKIKVIARGVLRPKSPFGGKLENLSLIEAVISSKESRDLQILTQADLIESFAHIRLKIDRLPYALAILELLNQVLEEHQPDAVFFDFCERMLLALISSKEPKIIMWYFLLKLSSFLGFKPNLEECHFCGTKTFKAPVFFMIGKGFIVCSDCSAKAQASIQLQSNEINFLQLLQKYPHRKIEQLSFPKGIKRDYTLLLLDYLNIHSERKITLKSFDLLI